jgi:hypothetical protein
VSDVSKNLSDLCDALEEEPATTGSALQVDSIHEQYAHLLTPEAAAALGESKPTTFFESKDYTDPNRLDKCSRAIYLTATARSPEGIDRAAKALIAEVNSLAARGLLRGHLAKLSKLSIIDAPLDATYDPLHEYLDIPQATALFIFPHVPAEWREEGVMFSAPEGSIPFDTEPDLKPTTAPKHNPNCRWCELQEKVKKLREKMEKAPEGV